MKIRPIFLLAYLIFLVGIARITWNVIDSEYASFIFAGVSPPLLSDKYSVFALLGMMFLFIAYSGNIIKRVGVIPCLLYLLSASSVIWTYDVGTTLYSLAVLTNVFGFALIATNILGFDRALRLIWIVSSVVIAVSVVLASVGSNYALMGWHHEGLWRGTFPHKNSFAPFVVINLLFVVFARRRLRLPWIFVIILTAVDIYAIIRAGSGTALIAGTAAVLAGAVFLPISNGNLRALWRTAGVASVLGLTGILVLSPDLVFEAAGRDSTMSSRTEIWAAAYDLTFANKLGTGYGTGGGSQVSIEVQKAVGRKDPQGVQSGYLTLALELGWPAVVLLVIWLLWEIASAMLSRSALQDQALFVALAVQHLIESFSESSGGIYPTWSLLSVLTALLIVRDSSDLRAPLTGHGSVAPTSDQIAVPTIVEPRGT